MNLLGLGMKYGTDKVSHGFCQIYDNKFSGIRQQASNILEIGVFFGASILMWKDYFPNATIYGIDTFSGLQGNGHRFENADKFYLESKSDKRIKLYVCDQGKEIDLQKFVDNGITFDVIIDDGSHLMRDQQLTLKYLFPLVKDGGWYVIEDVHSSLGDYDVLPDYSNTTLTMINYYIKGKTLKSIYTDMGYIESLITDMELFTINGSMTCIIKK